ncbi:MAG TPA: four helix bundle protein [Phycisphaerae bacterium]|nr:four helix bundle protein [Phycisphaerae bacterium]
MKYKRFEELPVWQAAMTLCERVFSIADDKAFGRKGDLRSQLQRAAISVANNIAEGFERGTTQELLTFLYIARGSAGEVRSMLLLAERLREFAHLKSEISDLKSQAESISRQLRAWADSLQNSDIPGQRYLTDQTRRAAEQKQRAGAFGAKLDRMVEEGRKARGQPGGEERPDLRSEI